MNDAGQNGASAASAARARQTTSTALMISSAPTLIAVLQFCTSALRRVLRTLIAATIASSATAASFWPIGPSDDELLQVGRGRDGERRSRTGRDDEEEGPAVEERRERSERVAQVHVETARGGVHRAQLAVGQRAEQRERAAHHPDQQRRAGVSAGLAQHAARHQEDARSDHRADHDEDQVAQAEDAVEGARRVTYSTAERCGSCARRRSSGRGARADRRRCRGRCRSPRAGSARS